MAGLEELKFKPFSSSADPAFWNALSSLKLEKFKLSAEPQVYAFCDACLPTTPTLVLQESLMSALPIMRHESLGSYLVAVSGSYTVGVKPTAPPRCVVGGDSFELDVLAPTAVPMHGTLRNTNTSEEFSKMDIAATVDDALAQLWGAITSGDALKDSSLLNRFVLNTFANLKKFNFYYWFAFPAIKSQNFSAAPPALLATFFSGDGEVVAFSSALAAWRATNLRQAAFVVRRADGGGAPRIGTLAEWPEVYSGDSAQFALGFVDPCAMASNPGWPLRNILATVSYHYGVDALSLTVLAVRGAPELSLALRVEVPAMDVSARAPGASPPGLVKGLEENKEGRLKPRRCDLSESMNPVLLATSAVKLNLQLMQWRLMPDIDLAKVKSCKCLLLGAGTLGCNVGRLLLGWGVEKITFVDNGTVSYSNPARQSLFTFEDSKEGRSKAEAAAARLREVFPGVDATGVSATIPMPGHPVSGKTEKAALKTAEKIDALIAEHDAVFLLMDSREARWLPTVLSAVHNKMCFTAAIGFDTYVAMRHGVATSEGRNVGCYFCNDVVAPTNSTKDRSLDQQCTVSRPGCSMLVSAAVTELLVSILHHPQGIAAPRPSESAGGDSGLVGDAPGSILGAVPHQIRGMLAEFGQMTIDGQAFDRCTGCSPKILEACRKSLPELVLGACNIPDYLETLSGLADLHAGVDDLDLDWADDDGDFGDD